MSATSEKTTMDRTGILAGRKMDSALILAYPNRDALHVFEPLGVEDALRTRCNRNHSSAWLLSMVPQRESQKRRANPSRSSPISTGSPFTSIDIWLLGRVASMVIVSAIRIAPVRPVLPIVLLTAGPALNASHQLCAPLAYICP